MEFIQKSRRYGAVAAEMDYLANALIYGGSVFIASTTENNYADKIAQYVRDNHGLDVIIERITKKEPYSPSVPVFDYFGEIIGVEMVEQVDVFVGWSIKSVKKDPNNQ